MKIRRILIITVFELIILAFMIFAMRDFTVFAIDLFWDLKAFVLIVFFPFGILLLTNSFNSMATYIYMPFDKKENTKEDLKNGIAFYNFCREVIFFLRNTNFLYFNYDDAFRYFINRNDSEEFRNRTLCYHICIIYCCNTY